jgi:aminoglycoside 6-adenylyltransferase
MRTEQEMMNLVLAYAKQDERIRAVGMNGSRTNPNAPHDRFQDFDMVYVVTDMDSFIKDANWIDYFGDRLIMQTPEQMELFPPELGNWFSYLMLFEDGNRIDMILVPVAEKEKYYRDDKLTVILLDKDDGLPDLPPPTDEDYYAKQPSAAFFADCCNEFWWVSTYVAKGLWRKEILYAQHHLNAIMRPMLLNMLEWRVGANTDYSVSIGKYGKYLERYLPEASWKALLSTYPGGSYEEVWRSLYAMTKLFRETALYVAEQHAFTYHIAEDERVSAYLRHIEALPADAAEIY